MAILSSVININPESVTKSYPHSEIEYIDISSVGTGNHSGTKTLALKDAPSRAKRIVKDGDTILATVRPNLRSFLYVKSPVSNAVASTGFAVLRAKSGKLDNRYLYYTVMDQQFTDYLTLNAKGSAYPAVDAGIIGRAEINLPELPEQQKIARVLGAYDDLIENNSKRIEKLEAMASLLYKTEALKVRAKTTLGLKVVIKKGKNITKATIRPGSVPVVAGGLQPAYYHDTPNTVGPVITISASGANAGYTNIYYQNIWASDCSCIDASATPHTYFFYTLLRDMQYAITHMQKGSAQPHVYPEDLKRLEIPDFRIHRWNYSVSRCSRSMA